MKRRRIVAQAHTHHGGRFAIVEPNADEDGVITTQLGRFLSLEVLSSRPKATIIHLNGPDTVTYDEESELFQKITKQKSQPEAGVLWGVELVVRVLDEEFNLFFGNNSSRQLGFDLATFNIGREVLLTQILIQSDRYSWYTPKVYGEIVKAQIENAVRAERAKYVEEIEDDGTCGTENCENCV